MNPKTKSPERIELERLQALVRKNPIMRDNGDFIATRNRQTGRLEVSTRKSDIEQWIAGARAMSLSHDIALGVATLIAEVADRDPQLALTTWAEEKASLEANKYARVVASWGLYVAHLRLEQVVRAHRFRALAERLLDDMSADEAQVCKDYALIPNDDAVVLAKPSRQFVNELGAHESLADWLRGRETLGLKSISAQFGAFVTNDRGFVTSCKDRLSTLCRQLAQHLAKPANYLLEASPGAGKSFFVRQFVQMLTISRGPEIVYLEKNLSAYPSIDAAFTDIILDVLLAIAKHRDVVLFVDEVDTEIEQRHIFQKLIAAMNGDSFFFLEKQISFAKQNLVGIYALSSGRAQLESKPKWPDFLSRVPEEHRFVLPSFNTPFEKLIRAASILLSKPSSVSKISFQAMLYLGLCEWSSARELEQSLELAKLRLDCAELPMELEHIATTIDDVVRTESKHGAILERDDFIIEIHP